MNKTNNITQTKEKEDMMDELKIKISEQLKIIEEMINKNCKKEEIEKERKKLDEMLEKYTEQL